MSRITDIISTFRLKTAVLRALALVVVFAAAAGASAQKADFKVNAPAQVVQGQVFAVEFTVTNSNARLSKAPTLNGCTLRYGPDATSTNSYTEFVNGRASSYSSVTYTCTYVADKAGKTTVPSVTINANGHRLNTQPKTITILPPGKSSQSQGRDPGYGQPAQQTHKATANDLIVTVTLSKNSMYEREAVIATIKVYTKYDIRNFQATTLPAFDGFISEELPVPQKPEIEHFRGDNYYSLVLKRCLLYPQKTGTLTINSGRYEVTLLVPEQITYGYFYTTRDVEQRIVTTSNSVKANVRALPSPAPAGFDGAVGTGFTAKATLEPSKLRTNEAATYTYSIKGTGNIKYLSAPDIDFGPTVEAYDPETESDASFTGSNMTGTFKATYSIVPTQVGELAVPAVPFVYFDTASGKYITIDVPAITEPVLKGNAVATGGTPQKGISGKQLDDILHIKTLNPADLHHKPERVIMSWPFWVICLAMVLTLVTAAIAYRRKLRLRGDIAGRREARANRVAVKRLAKARKAMARHNEEEFYADVALALWGYMGDKLRIPASALTRDNITEKLGADGVDDESIKQVIAVLDDCEMARFTPGSPDSKMDDLYNRASAAIKGLENSKRKKATERKQ